MTAFLGRAKSALSDSDSDRLSELLTLSSGTIQLDTEEQLSRLLPLFW